jgi:quinol monooxygenase YgiN
MYVAWSFDSGWRGSCHSFGQLAAETGGSRMQSLEIRIDVPPEKRREFLIAVESLIERAPPATAGCRGCRFFERHGSPHDFLWQEDWEERAQLEQRMASGDFRTLLGALRVLGRTHEIRITRPESAAER